MVAAFLVRTVVTGRPRCLLHRLRSARGGTVTLCMIVSVPSMVGCLEELESHPQDKDHGTRDGEWHMVEKNATMQVAAGAERLIRRSSGWLHAHAYLS